MPQKKALPPALSEDLLRNRLKSMYARLAIVNNLIHSLEAYSNCEDQGEKDPMSRSPESIHNCLMA